MFFKIENLEMKSGILEIEFKVLKTAYLCGIWLHTLKLEIFVQRFFFPSYM